ncbi:MAG TPA: Gfo/Idh/MocA family oxidoreductase [Nitrospirota bacterium]|nr:Gfo/Idh/MocA family oxidoreductase [Nitrospirota bacterium]
MTKLRVGVVGVGYLGRFHAEKYAAFPDVELVGIVDPDLPRIGQIADTLRTRAFTDPLKLLGQVDAVSIVVPTILHYRIARPFLEQGVHVLLEKPVTVTLEQADDLIGLAAKKGLILQVGLIERFNPAVTAVRPLIKSPRYLTAERSAPFTVRCTDVSVVLDLMIHDLDIVTDLAGSRPKEVSAAGAAVITGEIDMASARIVFENGCIADVVASRVSDEKKRMLRVFEGGSVYHSDYQSQTASVSRKGTGPVPELSAQTLTGTGKRDTLADELRAFVESVRTGTMPMVSGAEGRRALALATAIESCIKRGITGFIPVS